MIPQNLKSFTDAAAQRINNSVFAFEAKAKLLFAEYQLKLSQLDAKLIEVEYLKQALTARLAEVKDGRSVTIEEVTPIIIDEVKRTLDSWPRPEDGKSVNLDDVRPLIDEAIKTAVALIPPADDLVAFRASIEERLEALPSPPIVPDVASMISEAIAALPAPVEVPTLEKIVATTVSVIKPDLDEMTKLIKAIESAPTLPELSDMVDRSVASAVEKLPKPKDGEDVDLEVVREMVAEEVSAAVAALPPPLKGDPGPPGRLPLVKEWTDEVYYQGDVVTHNGSTYQATCDTAKQPPHVHWICLSAAGRDAKSPEVRGTWNKDEKYKALNIVALNGGSFMARKDDPGLCPGPDWQIIAMQGKQGKPGEGRKGDPGPQGRSVDYIELRDDGRLIHKMTDGTEIEVDFYPLLSRIE